MSAVMFLKLSSDSSAAAEEKLWFPLKCHRRSTAEVEVAVVQLQQDLQHLLPEATFQHFVEERCGR